MPSEPWFRITKEADLKKRFLDPPREFSLMPFWAWNDSLEAEQLRYQIDEMLAKGVYGAFLHARSGLEGSETPYFSDGWWQAVKIVVEYGAEKGFFTALYDEDRWPSGSAGGRVVASNREFLKRGLKIQKWELSGPRPITLDFPGTIVAILAGKLIGGNSLDPVSIVDLTDQAGEWEIPEGSWSVMCFTEVLDKGIQIDYLNKAAVGKFIELTHQEYFRRFSRHFGRTIPGIFFDEIYTNVPEADIVWSKEFLPEFEKRKGYDLKPLLPHLLYNVGCETPKIRCDYFDVFTSLFTEAWFKQIADWCEGHGIWLTGHTLETIRDYQSQGNYFATWVPVQIPGTDNEDYRYSFPRRVRWHKAKQLSSVAHIQGKKRAMVEALGGGGWVVPLHEYKIGLALLGVYGLNLFVPHLFHYSIGKPECMDDWPPSWFFRNPYWKYFRILADFGRRISFMGTIGKHVCDVGILYPITSLWAEGIIPKEDVGTLGGGETGDLLEMQYNALQEILLDQLVDYDILDPAAVCRSEVTEKKLRVGDEGYSVLILPPLTTIKRKVAAKIRTFFDGGGTVIALNQLPTDSMEMGATDGCILDTFRHIFGFDPRTIRIGYFETDGTFAKEYIEHSNENGGKAYFTKWTKHIPDILARCLSKDVEVLEGDGSGLRILHRKAKTHEIYFLVNGQKVSKTVTLSFRDGGTPECWDPETGTVKELTNYTLVNGKLTIPLCLEPWDACYIVCQQTDKQTSATMLTRTNLQDPNVTSRTENRIVVSGWRRGDAQSLDVKLGRTPAGEHDTITKPLEMDECLKPLPLDGTWEFILTPEELDQQWKPGIDTSIVELPTMMFHPEREGENGEALVWTHPESDNRDWKQIKIEDSHSQQPGCRRYLSSWDGAWINYYRYDRHWGVLGGAEVSFRRELELEQDIASGRICLTADKAYTLHLNDKPVGRGSNWKEPQLYDISSLLRKGSNLFSIIAKECKGLLIQGEIELTDGSRVRLISDHQWEASVEGGVWYPAFRYIYPPLGPWGEVPLPDTPVTFPATLWYRQTLPIGSKAVQKPVISGEHTVFVNGQELQFSDESDEANISHLMSEPANTLAVKVLARYEHDGIIKPLRIICGRGKVRLNSWTNQGLSWYSGRAAYSRIFAIPDAYIRPDWKLMLELGDVRYCAEIWVNDQLVTYRSWPPFTADITPCVHVGKNRITIIVANLLANRRLWEIYDCNLTDLRSRFCHEGAVFRESDSLTSGLLGPVRIIPYHHETLEIAID